MVNIYPNPADQFLNIELPVKGNYNAQILNTVGAVISDFELSGDKIVDVSSLSPGFYLLKISSNNSIGMQSFIKE